MLQKDDVRQQFVQLHGPALPIRIFRMPLKVNKRKLGVFLSNRTGIRDHSSNSAGGFLLTENSLTLSWMLSALHRKLPRCASRVEITFDFQDSVKSFGSSYGFVDFMNLADSVGRCRSRMIDRKLLGAFTDVNRQQTIGKYTNKA